MLDPQELERMKFTGERLTEGELQPWNQDDETYGNWLWKSDHLEHFISHASSSYSSVLCFAMSAYERLSLPPARAL
jgi:hypothetical protein